MKRYAPLVLLLLMARIAPAQSNVAGLLFASNFATWNVPQGNVGQMSWSSPSFCTVTSGGTTFRAFYVGVPITLNDSETPANTEVITPTVVNYSGFGCSFSAPTTHPHRTFYFTTGTAGLGEALAFAGTAAYQVVVTPDWQRLGGTTAMITSSSVGGTNVPILDQRSSVIVPYTWSGSAYVAQSFGGGPPTGAATGGLTGTYPGPGLSSAAVVAGVAGQSIAPKSFGGIYYYADQFSGTTFAQRVNACTAAAFTQGGGTCDLTTLVTDTGLNQVIDVPMIWGDSSGTSSINIEYILPPVAFETVLITNGACAITQYSGSTVRGSAGAAGSKTMVFQTQASTNIKAIYCTDTAHGWNNYIRAGDFSLRGWTAGATVTELADIEDMVDNSWFHDLFISNRYGDALYADHVCCGTTFEKISANSESTALGGIPLQFGAPSSGIMQAVTVKDSVFNSPGTGKHDMQIYNTWGSQFINIYMEGNGNAATPDTTTSMAYIDSTVSGLTWTGGSINSLCASPCASKYGIENHSTGAILLAGLSMDNDSYLNDVPNTKTYGNYGVNSTAPMFYGGDINSLENGPIFNGLHVVGRVNLDTYVTTGYDVTVGNRLFVGTAGGSDDTLLLWDKGTSTYSSFLQASNGNLFLNPGSGDFVQVPILNVTAYIKNAPYTVSTLPSASTSGANAQIVITDCTTFTPGALCTGGGSDYMIGISNGTVWTVH